MNSSSESSMMESRGFLAFGLGVWDRARSISAAPKMLGFRTTGGNLLGEAAGFLEVSSECRKGFRAGGSASLTGNTDLDFFERRGGEGDLVTLGLVLLAAEGFGAAL